MDLKQRISEQRPRENSGSRSANRFDYQKDWAILKLIELHKTGEDYLLVMDYYDDIVIFDSESDPKNMEFFQIKTSGGNWTLNKLLKRKKGESGLLPSIIGKMYGCKLQFPNHTLSLNFVSNSFLSIDLKDKKTKSLTKRDIPFSEICDKKLAIIINQIKEEHSLTEVPDFLELTFFKVSDLILNDREIYVRGKLSDFLEELNPKGTFKISLVYNTLFDEVKRKNNFEGNIANFDELSQRKGIGRSHFSSIIKNFTNDDSKLEKMWSLTENRLNAEGVPLVEIMELQEAWDTYKVEKMDLTNQYLQDIRKTINKIVLNYRANKSLYKDIIQPAFKDFVAKKQVDIYPEHYIKAIILMELYGI
ncbi:DUF4297 domain-containing protein [Metabacillus malikii]|uniref:CD-NTase associated protein 4-like DNA endonuclease domain-containing protein n=1 Tax=Metabacillus malikii TaxID=1504265 RepID=A0ABT9ZA05_9BACI|nr:DUF4297 domain-containing protein [Metabacillus malikii]MDQ0228855.1 hypothetical protein [Metabacillus malikii]